MASEARCVNPDCPKYGQHQDVPASEAVCQCGRKLYADRTPERAVVRPPETR